MIGHANLEGKNFLDLYTGTGAIGIRSLDLGAKNCFFVDINHEFLTIIKNKLITAEEIQGSISLILETLIN